MGQSWQGTPPRQIGLTQGYNYSQDPLYRQAAETLSNSPYLGQFNPQQYTQYFQEGVENPVLKNYREQILPSITQSYTQPGLYPGSALNKALAQSGEEVAHNLASLRANYLQQGMQSHAQNQAQALAQALGFSQAKAGQVSPLVQGAQSGWLQDLLKTLIGASGSFAQGYRGF